jgi:hypothetical protein
MALTVLPPGAGEMEALSKVTLHTIDPLHTVVDGSLRHWYTG